MYVWKIRFESQWTYNEDGSYEADDYSYSVVAETADEAIAKASKQALANTSEDELEGLYTVTSVRLISIKRGEHIDA